MNQQVAATPPSGWTGMVRRRAACSISGGMPSDLPHRRNAPFTVPEEQHHSSEPKFSLSNWEDGGQEPV